MIGPTRRKDTERWFVEHVQQHYPGCLPAARPRDFEGPDFLIDDDGSTVGLEVMQLFHPKQGKLPPELQIAQFQRDVVRRAKAIHQEQYPGRPLDVTTYYNRGLHLKGLEKCAQDLVDYMATLDYGTRSMTSTSPKGLSVIDLGFRVGRDCQEE